ncbi:hypothetical protein IWW50_005903 [Coemansia erecta]|nr:hypothetical protein GGF43_004858 [Coemansia sp. RSA 2618]KAJ2818190.1 hypothetical protein IWW50_005903 [Coemansia erecta]
MYTAFRHSHGIARRRRQSNSTLAGVPEDAESKAPQAQSGVFSNNSSRNSSNNISPVAVTEQQQQRPISLTSMPSVSSIRHDQESSGMFEAPSSYPSSVADHTAMASTPTFEYYGFVVYLVSFASFIVYLLWAYLPDQALEALGITYYPDRYWAVALPAWLLMVVAFIYLFNFAMNMYKTPLLSSPDNITDPYSNITDDISDARTFYYEKVGGIPPIHDIPISLVNECLYQ